MHRVIPSILTISLLLTECYIQPAIAETPNQATQSTWKKFVSQEYGFNILMLGEPHSSKANDFSFKDGKKINFQTFSSYQNHLQAVYGISITDVDNQLKDRQGQLSFFTTFLNSILSDQNYTATLIYQKDITINNYPGKEFKVNLLINNKKVLAIHRLYFINQRAYIIGVIAADNLPSDIAVNSRNFLDSFQLNP